MDLRTKTVIVSFIALIGFLGGVTFASLHEARANTALKAAIFGP